MDGYRLYIMKIDRDKILEKARVKEKKRQVMLYLPSDLYSEFQKACKGHVLSQVIEELIKAFLEDKDKA